MVSLSETLDESDERMLRRLVENHRAYTDSDRAAELLDDWAAALDDFVRVFPAAYAEVIAEGTGADVRGSCRNPPPRFPAPRPTRPSRRRATTDSDSAGLAFKRLRRIKEKASRFSAGMNPTLQGFNYPLVVLTINRGGLPAQSIGQYRDSTVPSRRHTLLCRNRVQSTKVSPNPMPG